MCKQKPGSSSRGERNTSVSVDVSPTTVCSTPNNPTHNQPAAMPSVGACYKVTTDKKTPPSQSRMIPEQLTQPDAATSTMMTSMEASPWSPAIISGVIPDPCCPRRTEEMLQQDSESLPCGSEESLLPRSEGGSSASACACSSTSLGPLSDVDLIRFSPGNENVLEEVEEAERLVVPNHEVVLRGGSCLFSCDRGQFDDDDDEDDVSDGDEFQDAVDDLNLDPFPICITTSNYNNLDVVALPSQMSAFNRNGSSLSREASDLFLDMILPKRLGLPQVRSAAEISVASSTVSQKSLPICRICHLPASEDDTLMSPCRCSGTMRFIHTSCLMKWLEISSTRSKRPPSCELCLYQYHRHKKFKINQWQFPQCSKQDKLLHVIFVISLVVMLGCATATILCFKQDKGIRSSAEKSELTKSEVVTLVCGVFFFVAFFVAMYVEVKSRNTIYKLCVKFIYLNQQWYIDEYDKRKDVQPVSV